MSGRWDDPGSHLILPDPFEFQKTTLMEQLQWGLGGIRTPVQPCSRQNPRGYRAELDCSESYFILTRRAVGKQPSGCEGA